MKPGYEVKVLKAAEIDAAEAAAWYESQSPGLGHRFLDAFEDVLRKLPTFWNSEIRYSTVRTRAFIRFPYSIHYRVNEEKQIIAVEAVLHHKRKPRF